MQLKTKSNPKGAGRKPAPPQSKTLQIRSVPLIFHEKIKEYTKSLISLDYGIR